MRGKGLPLARVRAAILVVAFSALAMCAAPGVGRASANPVTLSPASSSFGSVAVDTAGKVRIFTLRNNQAVALNVLSITFTGANAGDFSQSGGTCGAPPGSLAAGASCTITVTFTPSTLTTETATLTVNDDAPSPYNSLTSSLSGSGVPEVTLTPGTHNFVKVALRMPSSTQNFTLHNSELVALSISSIGFTGTNAGDFSQTNTCGNSLASYASCTISVTLTPSVLGAETAMLTVNDSAAALQYQTVTSALSGTGVADLTLTPASLNFGSVAVNTGSKLKTFTLQNNDLVAANISSIAFTGANAGDFSHTGGTCGAPPTSLAASSSCTITVTFTPSTLAAETATLTVTDNAAVAQYDALTSALSGSGVQDASLTPASYSFGNVVPLTMSSAEAFTLHNSELVALSISSIGFTGTNAGDFSQTNNCGSSLASYASCTISVTLTPRVLGAEKATLTVNESAVAPYNTLTTALSGSGTGPVDGLTPTSISFGSQSVGTTSAAQSVTLTNSGNAALSVTGVTLAGTNASAFAQSNTCGSSVAAGGTCTISVTFTPTASGSDTASVSIADNASGSPQGVSLSGTGTTTVASLSPTSVSFGNEPIDVTSSAQSVTLSNTGTATLGITSIGLAGTNASDFAQSNACGSSLAAGANCTIVVMFTPSEAAAETASLSITDNASGSPQTVSLTGTGTHDVILSWTASTSSAVAGYNVYRGTSSGGESSTPLNSTPVNGTTYTDATVTAGTTYYYVVMAVNSSNVQSAASNESEATVP